MSLAFFRALHFLGIAFALFLSGCVADIRGEPEESEEAHEAHEALPELPGGSIWLSTPEPNPEPEPYEALVPCKEPKLLAPFPEPIGEEVYADSMYGALFVEQSDDGQSQFIEAEWNGIRERIEVPFCTLEGATHEEYWCDFQTATIGANGTIYVLYADGESLHTNSFHDLHMVEWTGEEWRALSEDYILSGESTFTSELHWVQEELVVVAFRVHYAGWIGVLTLSNETLEWEDVRAGEKDFFQPQNATSYRGQSGELYLAVVEDGRRLIHTYEAGFLTLISDCAGPDQD